MITRCYWLRVLLVCVCLFALFLPSHIVYASDDYIINFDDFTYLDPYAPMVMSDDIEELPSSDATYSTAFRHESATDFTWHNFINDVQNVQSGTYFWLIWQNLKYDIPSGTYDIKLKLSVADNNYVQEPRFTIDFLSRDSSQTVGPLTPDTFAYTGKTSTESAYYTITFKNVKTSFDIGRIKLFGQVNVTADCQLKIVPTVYEFKAKDETKGLLNSIIELIRNIIDGIIDLPNKIKTALSSLFDLVVNAITDLGNFIINGIKNLFIPSQDDITSMKDKFDQLLANRFGALYQVASLITDYANTFTSQSKNTITFPSVTIPLGEADFVFGGWEVQIVPPGFDVVFTALKLITSILATFLFVNGMRNRFDKLLGGADDI